MADYFGPPKLDFGGLDPIGSFQKGQKFGLENRARGELAKCAPDDFGCMTKVLMSLDPEQAVRAAQVQGQLGHQKIMEKQGADLLKLRIAENTAQENRAAAAATEEARQFGVTSDLRKREVKRAEEASDVLASQRLDEANKEIGPVVSLLPAFRTARDDIAEGNWNTGSTRQNLVNFAAAIGMAIGDKNPQAFAQANVPALLSKTEDAKKVLENLQGYLPSIAARAKARGLPYTEEQFKVPDYVSKEKQEEINRNPPTETARGDGLTAPPYPEKAKRAGISEKQWKLHLDPEDWQAILNSP